MQEEHPIPADQPSPAGKLSQPLHSAFRRVGFMLGLVVVVWVIFGMIIPRTLFPEAPPLAVAPQTQPPQPMEKPPPATTPAPAPEETPAMESVLQQSLALAHSPALEEKITALEARIQALEETARQAVPHAPEAQAMTAETLRQMEERIKEQEQQSESLKAEISEEQKAAWRIVALWQAYDTLAEEARAGGAFADSLFRLASLANDNAVIQRALDELKPYADHGVVTIEFLRENFADIIPEALIAYRNPGENAQLQDKVAINLASLVSIRKVGMLEGTTPEAIVARAELKLKEADVAAALGEIKALPEASKAAFVAWVELAQGYVARATALESIRRELMARTQATHATPEAP